jgi:putative endonuclease
MSTTAIQDKSAPAHTRAKGRLGEDAAADYLVSAGWSVVSRNYQSKRGEIDIIAKDPGGWLVFIEVKAAYGPSMGDPLFRVTRSKQLTIIALARKYLYEHSLSGKCRFDVVSITRDGIKHLKNAFIA